MGNLDLDLDLAADAALDRRWDVLVLYLLVESTLGECALTRRLGAAYDHGSDADVEAALAHFEAQPADLKSMIRDGDPTLDTLQQSGFASDGTPLRRSRPASA